MIVDVHGKRFVASYFPFFRKKRYEDFEEWGLRLADGSVSEVTMLVFNTDKPIPEIYENAAWLINEYILEEDDMLTQRALNLKRQLMEIFCERTTE
jgi:hypothetical protein